MYKIGQHVSLTCKFRSHVIFNESGYEEFNVSGVVVKTPSYIEYDAVAIRTDDADIPLRIIPLRTVEGYIPVETKSAIETHEIVSGANTYIVTVNKGKVSCSCVGFQFRRYCKHSDTYKT